MVSLKIKKVHEEAIVPTYAKKNDAGMDLHSVEELMINPGEKKLVSTGISMAIPPNFVGLIWDKSGIAANHGIKSMGGVIDTGYRGEIKVVLHNLSDKQFEIKKGMKIAQMLIQPVEQPYLIEVDELDESDRGTGGFGSTGL